MFPSSLCFYYTKKQPSEAIAPYAKPASRLLGQLAGFLIFAYFTTPMAFICAGMDMVAMPLV